MKQWIMMGLMGVSSLAFGDISAGSIASMVNTEMNTTAPPVFPPGAQADPSPPIATPNGIIQPVDSPAVPQGLSSLSSRYEFVVFFLSTCPHCARFLPILKDYANAHGINVVAFSEDGPGEADYPNPLPATAQILAHFGNPQEVPALFLVDKNNLNVPPYPIVEGEEPEAALDQQVQALANQLGVSL